METRHALVIILLPLFLFVVAAIIIWAALSSSNPFVPIGPTGGRFPIIPPSPTGITGVTGSTGGRDRLLQKAIKDNLRIVPYIDPLKVLDIVSIDGFVVALTHDQILIGDEGHKHTTSLKLTRVIGFNGHLLVLDSTGKLWILESDLNDTNWNFTAVDTVNRKGQIVWVSTTNDQDFLWITYAPIPGQQFAGVLYNTHFKIKDKSKLSEYRIYGTTPEKYVILHVKSKTLTTLNGNIYFNVTSGLLNNHNDLHTISGNDTPPLMGLRLVCSSVYTLVVKPIMATMQRIPNQNDRNNRVTQNMPYNNPILNQMMNNQRNIQYTNQVMNNMRMNNPALMY